MANDPYGVSYWRALKTPKLEDLFYQLDELISQGVVIPEDVEVILQDPSLLSSFVENPELITSQLNSLRELENLGQGKLTDVDKANMIQQMQLESQQEKANRDAILSNARARGVAGSGVELAAQLSGQQTSANRAGQLANELNLSAQRRGLEALTQAGSLAGQMRGQELDVASKKAAAVDAINQWNAANKQGVATQNVEARNAAQMANLAERQRIADANIGLRNQEKALRADAIQKDYENRLQKLQNLTSAMTGNYDERMKERAEESAKKAAVYSGLGSIVGAAVGGKGGAEIGAKGGAAMGNEAISDKRAKNDIEEWNPSEFLDKISPIKFKYKPEYGKNPDIEHKGVAAQDVERGAPAAVKEINGVKTLDLQELTPMLLAALADVNKRLKKVEK